MNLTGRLNKRGVISPRFDVHLRDLEEQQKNLLPSCRFVLTLSCQPQLASWTMKKQDENIQEGKKILGLFF